MSATQTVGLALQGGGAHGAFTWGVLDRLLEHGDVSFDRVSATSSGGLNALAMAQGWMSGGREGARACLDVLWQRIGGHPHAPAWIFGSRMPASQPSAQNLHRYYGARQINPQSNNPVAQIAEVMFDFEQLRAESPFAVYLGATRVREGALVIFGPEQLTVDAVMASTCLPQIFAPVTIDGEAYWDGAWAGNPTLEPLIGRGRCAAVLAVLVQALNHQGVPTTPEKIATRIGELGSSSAFLRELRSQVLDANIDRPSIQLIEPGQPLHAFHEKESSSSAIGFLSMLRDHGRRCAEEWIKAPERHAITRESSLFRPS